jgi:murein DD-endopeptidase MepM/ murein hydrolase activator NlpD
MKRFFAVFLAILLLFVEWDEVAIAYVGDVNGQSAIPVYEVDGRGVIDWSAATFNDLRFSGDGGVQSTPEINQAAGVDLSMSWQAGETFSDAMDVSTIQGLGVGELTGTQIGQLANNPIDYKSIALDSVSLYANQTIGNLVDSVPGLKDLNLGAAQPIFNIADTYLRGQAKEFVGKELGSLLKDVPGLKDLKLGDFDLQNFNIGSIPGLADTAIGKLTGWNAEKIGKIPGLGNISIAKLANYATYMPMAIHSDTHSKEEANATFKPVSGGEAVGWNYPCKQKSCAYVELADYRGGGVLATLKGSRWIKGGLEKDGGQMVDGGSGFLKTLSVPPGKEPTGRPLGPDFKIVITDTIQPKGTATYSLFTHVCMEDLGCTPYFIGPIPFLSSHENGPVFMGTPDHTGKSFKLKGGLPKGIQSKISNIIAKYAPQALDMASGLGASGGSGAGLSDCTQKALSVVNPDLSSQAASVVPLIVQGATSAGLTANQTAIALAVAEVKYEFKVDPSRVISEVKTVAQKFANNVGVDYFGAMSALGLPSSAASKAAAYQAALKPCQQSTCSSTGRYIQPTPGVVISEFGMRLHPIYGTWKLHAGQDRGDGTGTPIHAVDCGKVDYIGWDPGGYGSFVDILHGNGLVTRSAHQSQILVKVPGQTVKQGEVIGLVGQSGGVTGPHLHFETRRNGKPENPRNYGFN